MVKKLKSILTLALIILSLTLLINPVLAKKTDKISDVSLNETITINETKEIKPVIRSNIRLMSLQERLTIKKSKEDNTSNITKENEFITENIRSVLIQERKKEIKQKSKQEKKSHFKTNLDTDLTSLEQKYNKKFKTVDIIKANNPERFNHIKKYNEQKLLEKANKRR